MSKMRRHYSLFSLFFAVVLTAAWSVAQAAAPAAVPPELEGLVKVKSKNLDAIYLLPGADFNAYPKIMSRTNRGTGSTWSSARRAGRTSGSRSNGGQT